ncbi:MAG: DUF5685 family protein [Caldicoprobacterales bacterium]|jgi:hypothetical protein|nr:hypothetical protein [Clostridiales bacterium]
MFGYVMPDKPELRIREYEIYRAYYCGVCRAIKAHHGNLPRLTLNYDITFLALLLSSLTEAEPRIQAGRCILHPLKKRKFIINSEILDYAADMNVLLSWLNLKDKREDDRSALALAGLSLLKPAYERVKARYPGKSKIIHDRLKELAELESNCCDSIDAAAEPFAKLMEEVIAYPLLCKNEKNETLLRWMGYHIGKWIYTIDALDDLEKDIRKKSYNPFLCQYDYRGENIKAFKDRILNNTRFVLTYTLSEIANSFELLPFLRNKEIAGNIIYLGMQKKTESLLGKEDRFERPVRSAGNT